MPITFQMLCDRIFVHFRKRRMRRFLSLIAPTPGTRVLDIGGTPQTWLTEAGDTAPFPVCLVNLRPNSGLTAGRITSLQGDATNLPFPDDSFDLVFSNSVIEHLTTWERQQAFAREARRIAPELWIQTPARSFPIEAHLLAPYIQYLPRGLQHRLARFTPRGLLTPLDVYQIVDEIRLLTFKEMRQLFPDCVILKERVAGITKSYIATRRKA